RDFYFLIQSDDDFHGLIHCSSIDWEKKLGQSGLFIRTEAFQGTPLPVCASALMLEYFFQKTSLEAVEAKVMNDNVLALRYNMGLGFREITSAQSERYMRLRLERNAFYRDFSRQLQLLKRVHSEP